MKIKTLLLITTCLFMHDSFAQTSIDLSQLINTEWEQVFDTDRGFTRHLSLSPYSAKWAVKNKKSGDMLIEREYYLSDKEPEFEDPYSEHNANIFDKGQVGVNQSGKYLYAYDAEDDVVLIYVVKQFTNDYLYLEVPGAYTIKDGKKIDVSKTWVMTLKRVQESPSKPSYLNGNANLEIGDLCKSLIGMYKDYFYYRNDTMELHKLLSALCTSEVASSIISDLCGYKKERLTNDRHDYELIKSSISVSAESDKYLVVSFRSAKSPNEPIETVKINVYFNDQKKISKIEPHL